MNREASPRELLFWELADDLLREPAVTRGTMMGYPCLRNDGSFFAGVERSTDNLIVKLPQERVVELVRSGQAFALAPNGRTFREWASVPMGDRDEWLALLIEARSFAG
jgi:hypothetical protein